MKQKKQMKILLRLFICACAFMGNYTRNSFIFCMCCYFNFTAPGIMLHLGIILHLD